MEKHCLVIPSTIFQPVPANSSVLDSIQLGLQASDKRHSYSNVLIPFSKRKNNKIWRYYFIPLQALNKQTFMITRQRWHTPWAEPVWSEFETSLINTEFQDSQQNPISKYKYNDLNICLQTFHQRHSYQKKVKYILFLAHFNIQEKKHEVGLGINLGRAGEEKDIMKVYCMQT